MEMIDIITSVGFPIAACVVLFKMLNDLIKEFNKLNTTLQGLDVRLQYLERHMIREGVDDEDNKKQP